MEYISAVEAAEKWSISKGRVQLLCSKKRVVGVMRVGNMWLIPKNSNKPIDARLKYNLHDSSKKSDKVY